MADYCCLTRYLFCYSTRQFEVIGQVKCEMPLARVIEVNVSEGEHICAALCADTDHSIHALPGASEDSVPDVSENRCPDW